MAKKTRTTLCGFACYNCFILIRELLLHCGAGMAKRNEDLKKKWFDWISVSRSHPSVQIWNVNPSNRKTPWLSASCCNKNIPHQICKERSNKRERKKNASGESRSNSKLIYGRWYIPICLKIAIKNPKNQHTFVITIWSLFQLHHSPLGRFPPTPFWQIYFNLLSYW